MEHASYFSLSGSGALIRVDDHCRKVWNFLQKNWTSFAGKFEDFSGKFSDFFQENLATFTRKFNNFYEIIWQFFREHLANFVRKFLWFLEKNLITFKPCTHDESGVKMLWKLFMKVGGGRSLASEKFTFTAFHRVRLVQLFSRHSCMFENIPEYSLMSRKKK